MLVFPFLTALLGIWQIQEVRVLAAELVPPPDTIEPACLKLDIKGSVCANAGGQCLSYLDLKCDHIRKGLCYNSFCYCCINCSNGQEYSDCAKAGGTCRRNCECNRDEYQDVHRCPASGCTCCLRKCEDDICSKVGGYCVAPEVKCMPNYARFKCGCGDCACCVPYELQAKATESLTCKAEK